MQREPLLIKQQLLTPYQSLYFAWLLTRRAAGGSVDSQVDLNPHQVDAALFACRNPLSRGVILADEVGLGKTIEAGLVISQRWAERRRRILIIVPANLRKQWHQELLDKFSLQSLILETKSYNAIRKQTSQSPFENVSGPVICSYQFAKAKANDIKNIQWNLVVLDEAHRMRNVYKTSNVIAKTLKEALAHVHSKILLTATASARNSLFRVKIKTSPICAIAWLRFANAPCVRKCSPMFHIPPVKPSSRNLRHPLKSGNYPGLLRTTCGVQTLRRYPMGSGN
jgi:superfamily II DNA or RNA helicase